MRRRAAVLLALPLVLGLASGCGDDDPPATGIDAGATTSTPASDDEGDDAGAGAATSDPQETEPDDEQDDGGSTTTEGGTTSSPAPDPADLPGEEIAIYPYEGDELAVVGVEEGDSLNVRSGPGADFDVVTELDPVTVGLVATGHNRQIDDDSVWAEVTTDDGTGWANVAYLAQLGDVTSISDDVVIPDPDAASVDIAREVALQRAGEGAEPPPTVVVVRDADASIVDVLGYADDAQRGERIEVAGGAGSPIVVSSTALCARGVSDGLCA